MTTVSTGAGREAHPSAEQTTRRLSLREGAEARPAAPRIVALSRAGDWVVTIYPSRIIGHVDVHLGGAGRPTVVIAGFRPTGRGSLVGFGGEWLADAFHTRSDRFGEVCDYLLGMPAEHERLADAVAVALANGWPPAAVDIWLASEQANDIATAVRNDRLRTVDVSGLLAHLI